MKRLQDNLNYYERQRQEIIRNKDNYQSVRYRQEYGSWQPASYTFSGHEILAEHGTNWWYSINWKKGRFGHHMKNDECTQASVRQAIATKLGRPLDEISPCLNISARGEDPTHWFAEKCAMFNTYTIGYQYRNLCNREEKYYDHSKYEQALRECEQNIRQTRQALIEAQEFANQQKELTHKAIQEVDHKVRAFLLAGVWGTQGSEDTISSIKSLGFDANELAHHAIAKNNSDLFDIALQYGANCSNYFINEQSLLQRIIQENKEVLLQKYLAKGEDVATTIINAIAHDDIATITKLASNKPGLLEQKFAGFTLLQIAIAAEGRHKTVVEKILALNPQSAEILTNNGESALKIATRVGNEEIIQLVSNYANLETEIAQLGTKIDETTKAQLGGAKDIERVIELFKQGNRAASRTDEDSNELLDAHSSVEYTQEFAGNFSATINDPNQGVQGLGFHDHHDS